ncbi:sulfite exporter TauE/SafE family protein [Rhodohalobacter mucosus]|uniref:Probable membrane transporter protein n=1 Tax=Rhodohalobacter mucosus TaxID=2079485 RepID=A0A316TT35_9BACT|nr:sulfite exporter TauE/SafE family protein [Rhodohalobacter mucosus]PWN06791.1 sulfite exporter TauE/SafE family protein [Rhodohalobacter mucosus]
MLPANLRKKPLRIFLAGCLIVLASWAIYMSYMDSWGLFAENWFMTLVMIFGSLIAGASSEGGGAIAYPVMTLIFSIEPDVARNFSFAIQSFGMTSAAIWILLSGIRVEKTYLLLAGLGGLAGIVSGSWLVAPFVVPSYAKMMFVSFWLSFGLALWAVNFSKTRKKTDRLPALTRNQKLELVLVGVAGGVFSSIFGNGLDICTFSYVVLKYGLSEKVATPTSVILMASNAVAGYFIQGAVLQNMQPEAIGYLLVCIPVVIFGAPVGAYTINRFGRRSIAFVLISIIVLQFFTAIYVIRPDLTLSLFSAGVFVFGVIFFFLLTRNNRGIHNK